MKASPKSGFPNNYVTLTLLGILLLLLLGVFYSLKPIIRNTQIYKGVEQYYQDNTWVTFTSKRAKFSFKHPISWPVTQEPDSELKQDVGYGIESIDFDKEWFRNAGGPRLGFIVVQEIKDINNLDDYIKKEELLVEKYVDMFIKGRTQKVTIPPSQIEYLKIGGEEAIKVTSGDSGLASFSNNTSDYRVVRKGLLYRFVTIDSLRFLENKEKNSKTFQQIIASVKFLD